jgi:hypothetical protein
MTDSVKATRAIVTLGSLTIDGFMLPDGSYRMSLTQAAECVGLGVQNASDFLRSKAIKSLMGEAYTPQIFEIESEDQARGQSRIRALPLPVVCKYWLWQSHRGNKQALALVDALMAETLERRFDSAFGVTRAEDDWDKRLSDRIIAQLETDLSFAMAETDIATYREKLLEDQLRQNGIEPWTMPNDESNEEGDDRL